MRRAALVVFVLFVGFSLGWLGRGCKATRPEPPHQFKQPISLKHGDGPTVFLVPYAVAIDGRSERLGDKPESPNWIVWLDGARVQLSYAEVPSPR